MNKKEKIKKVENGIGDLRFVAALASILLMIIVVLNIWDGIKVSVDVYVENQNNNIIEYTTDFIENTNDENIDKEEIEYIKTEKDANNYMISYIADEVLYIIISIIGAVGFWGLANFYNKENMENPFSEKVIESLKTTAKIMRLTWIIWIVGEILFLILFGICGTSIAYYASSMVIDIIIYLIALAFIRFIIFILEKGQLKKTSKEV